MDIIYKKIYVLNELIKLFTTQHRTKIYSLDYDLESIIYNPHTKLPEILLDFLKPEPHLSRSNSKVETLIGLNGEM